MKMRPWIAINLVAAFASAPLGAETTRSYDPSIFFGFDLVLTSIVAKAACGGDIGADIASIKAYMALYPEESIAAEMPQIMKETFGRPYSPADLDLLFGVKLVPRDVERVCEAALQLGYTLATPDGIGAAQSSILVEQKAASAKFFQTLETLRMEIDQNSP